MPSVLTRCFRRLFDDDRNIIIIDILVVRGCCVGEDLPKISGLKKMSVNQVRYPIVVQNTIASAPPTLFVL